MFKSLVFLLLIIAVTVKGEDGSDDDKTECDGKQPTVNASSGQLRINGTIKDKMGKTCEWIIDGTVTKGPNIYLAFDENLVLTNNDTLKIITEDGKNTTLFESKGFQWPGVILLAGNQKIKVQLIVANESYTRNWDVLYGTNSPTVAIQNIETTGKFVFPHNKEAVLNSDFKIVLKTKNSDQKLLLNLESIDLNGASVKFSKVAKHENESMTGPSLPDFLLSNDSQIDITISQFKALKTESKGLQLHFDLVDSVCTQFKSLDAKDIDVSSGTVDILFPNKDALQLMSSFRCLNIFEIKNESAKFLLDLRSFHFKNSGDLMTVLDGNSRENKALAVIESQLLNSYWRDMYLYSSTNKIWIMFESPQVINKEPDSSGVGVQALSQGGMIFVNTTGNNTTILEITDKTKPPTLVFTLKADPDKQIVIDFDEKTILPGTAGQNLIEIYESSGRSGQPFIKMSSGEHPPDIMASNDNQMKIVFKQIVNLKVTLSSVDRGCHSTYLGTNGASFSMSGTCTAVCSWLIPKKENSTGTYVFQFSHLNLPQNSDTVMIEMLGTTSSSVLNLNGPLTTTSFPDLILNSNQTYVLYLRRKCEKGSVDSSQLIGVSLVYVDHDLTTHEEILDKDKTLNLMTANYPNYYSVGSDHLWKISPVVNQTVKALLTFTDFGLSPGHQLLLRSKNLVDDVNKNVSEICDQLVTLPLFMNLTSHSIDATKQPFSGRGFTATLATFSCGDNLTLEAGKDLVLSTPTPLTGISKCVWMVSTQNPNNSAIALLEFNIDDKDLENSIRIYDSNSIRDNKFLNLTYFNTSRKSSSTNSLIIEYTIDAKTPKPLNLTFKQTVCQSKCIYTKRCLLPEFFCNGINDCGDFSDERCNGSQPIPPPPTPEPAPIVYHSGVNGWVVFLVICPLMIGVGVLGTIFGPHLLNRVGRGRYREFQDFSEVS